MSWGAEEWSAFFAACAVAFALWEYNGANRTRAKDLRWRQAERADDILKQILENPKVINAFHLLDWNGGKRFAYTNGDETGIITATWLEQDDDLRKTSASLREMFVRESFDALYEAFERLEHAMNIGVVTFDDIAQPFRFYVGKISERRAAFARFEDNQGYDKAQEFLKHYGVTTT